MTIKSSSKKYIKYCLKSLGLLKSYFYFRDHIIHRDRFSEAHINFKKNKFNLWGPTGDFLYSVNKYGCYEPILMEKVIDIIDSNDFLLDIGCAEGYFSSFVVSHCINPLNVFAFDGDDCRSRLFSINNRKLMKGQATLIRKMVGCEKDNNTVSVDHFICNNQEQFKLSNRIVLKVDVEGSEVDVLKSMIQTMHNFNVILFLEVHPEKILSLGYSFDEMVAYINKGFKKIEFCENHRGRHRGKVSSWKTITGFELINHCKKVVDEHEASRTLCSNFAICCS